MHYLDKMILFNGLFLKTEVNCFNFFKLEQNLNNYKKI